MVDPEFTDLGYLAGKCRILCLWMGEAGRVKVDAKTSFLGKFYPFCKMLWLDLVTVYELAILENRVAGMEIDPVLSRDQA